jgi:hypothetical protein
MATYDGQHATNVLESCTLVVAVVYALGQTIGPRLNVVVLRLLWSCSHHVVAWDGRHLMLGSTYMPYPGSLRARKGG